MIKTIGVVGAGVMGNGIAHVFAWHGYDVILYDVDDSKIASAMVTIRENLGRQAKKGVVDSSCIDGIMGRIRTTMFLSDLAPVDFVVEAVTENKSLKVELFRKLDEIVREDVILASNTSSIPITTLAAVTKRPGQVIGMHFMNPAPMMPLVELIRSQTTSDETLAVTVSLAASLEKETVLAQDYPGFIINRILIPMINEAIFALFEGVATAEDIDKGMKLGTNQPIGPLALADLIGLDTVLAIANVLYDGFKDQKYRPCPLLVKMVAAGFLGRKTGRGFFSYQE